MASGAHKKEHFISLNLFGQVPAFEDGDLILFGKQMSAFFVWMEVEAHQFDPVASKLWRLTVKQFLGMSTDNAVGTRSMKMFDERPHVKAWVEDIIARPAWG
ncbi:hypothetical protein ACFE04_001639 [Oxalis oulophora]